MDWGFSGVDVQAVANTAVQSASATAERLL
jgi:hypothetical protein